MKNSINFLNKSEFVKVDKSEDRVYPKILFQISIFQKKITLLLMDMRLNIKNNEKIFR